MKHETHCSTCALSGLCLPLAIAPDDLDSVDSIIERSKPLQSGEHLYRSSEPFRAVYAVRSGALKIYTISSEGEEQVNGFHLPGEIVGLDGISTGTHVSSAVALDTTSVCAIPYDQLQELAMKVPNLQGYFFRLLSREIVEDQHLAYLLSHKKAEQRIASLLWSLSARHKRRGLSSTRFQLPMSRNDIANYLGLAVETVSRVFTRLQAQEVISVDNREVALLDPKRLASAAGIDWHTNEHQCAVAPTGS